ncbi:MAG TPA: hypothetical protein VMM77_02810, partial [Gemmatimonadaceae bacterium]|nr:hypothetical protein [Gemmatimonadaceae bacterium]
CLGSGRTEQRSAYKCPNNPFSHDLLQLPRDNRHMMRRAQCEKAGLVPHGGKVMFESQLNVGQ